MKRYARVSNRLPDYDYSQSGAYFITVCTHGRVHLFGEIVEGAIRLSELGIVVQSVWNDLPLHYSRLIIDAFVIMPNHIHCVVFIGTDGAGLKTAPTMKHHGLPEIIRGFKTFSSRRINEKRQTMGISVWQRGYHEHIIRDDESLDQIREYIANNPLKWDIDRENGQRNSATSVFVGNAALWEI